MKKLLFPIIIFIISGCNLFTPLPAYLGKEVKVDADTGYFEEKIVYTESAGAGYKVYTFDTNGFYSYEVSSWDTIEEQYSLSAGDWGSYSWDPDSLVCQFTITHEYDNAMDEWIETAQCPYSESFPAYFTDQYWYGRDRVLIMDETNDRLYVTEYSSSTTEGINYNYTVNVQINNDEVGVPFEVFIAEERSDETGPTDKDETELTGTITGVYRSKKQAGKGDITTYQIEFSATSRDWDPVTEWEEWSTPYQYQEFRTFLNMKTFLIEDPSIAAARKLP